MTDNAVRDDKPVRTSPVTFYRQVVAELRIMHLSVPYLKDRGTHGKFELGSFSLEYHAFIKYVTMVYPLLWLPLYLVMWKARAKKFRRGKGKKEA